MVSHNGVEVLERIPVALDVGTVLKRLRLRSENKHTEAVVRELIEIVSPVAKPKSLYKIAYVDNKSADSLEIDGVRFTSRVLRINLEKVERVFPYVATCGQEVEKIHVPASDVLKGFCLDVMKTMILGSAVACLQDYLTKSYALGQLSHMNPGSLESWPITQQKELFFILGNVEDLIGVKLTEHCTMVPVKSVSGICFPTEIKFESCQLCPREKCIGRRAAFNPELAKKYREQA